jgi:fatty acid desaturase
VAHHLAPTLTFFELPAVTERLRAELYEAGVELPTHRGLWAALRSHATLLRLLSRPDDT